MHLCAAAFVAAWLLYTNTVKYIHVLNVGVCNCACMCMCVYGNRITPGTGRGHKLVQNGGGSQQGMELSWA